METEIFYKETNTHDYLNFSSHFPDHLKQFFFDLTRCIFRRGNSNAPIERATRMAKLQGPANKPANSKNTSPLVSAYYSNFDMQNIVKSINQKPINQKLKQRPNQSIN